MNESEIEQAISLVVADVRRSYPEMTRDEAVSHAHDTLTEADLEDSELDRAYAVVLCLFENPELVRERQA